MSLVSNLVLALISDGLSSGTCGIRDKSVLKYIYCLAGEGQIQDCREKEQSLSVNK